MNNAKSCVVSYCFNYGNITGTGYSLGGIIGTIGGGNIHYGGIVRNCINYGDINGVNRIGGIVGNGYDITVEESVNYGSIIESLSEAGGIIGNVGDQNCIIKNCYNFKKIISQRENTNGGIVGKKNGGQIENCYNIGECIGKQINYGAIIMPNMESEVTVIHSYYLNEELEDGTVMDENFMKSKKFVDMLNIDTETGENTGTYVMDTKGINNGYPILKWQLENLE